MTLLEAARAAKATEEENSRRAKTAYYDRGDSQARTRLAYHFNSFAKTKLIDGDDLVPMNGNREAGSAPTQYEIACDNIRFRLTYTSSVGVTIYAKVKPNQGGGTGFHADWIEIHKLSDLAKNAAILAYETPQPATHGTIR